LESESGDVGFGSLTDPKNQIVSDGMQIARVPGNFQFARHLWVGGGAQIQRIKGTDWLGHDDKALVTDKLDRMDSSARLAQI
jgi:hypothetical protein